MSLQTGMVSGEVDEREERRRRYRLTVGAVGVLGTAVVSGDILGH